MSVKLPVVTWKDARGKVTAKSLFGVPACAVDDDESKALSQVKRYINWRMKRDYIYELPKIVDVQMDYISVELRPVRELNKRKVVSAETVNMRTLAVYGKRENGYFVCSLPFFRCGIRFTQSRACASTCQGTGSIGNAHRDI